MSKTNWLLVLCLVVLGAAWLYTDVRSYESLDPPEGPAEAVPAPVPLDPKAPKVEPPKPFVPPVRGEAKVVLQPVAQVGPGPMGPPPMGGGPGFPGGPGPGGIPPMGGGPGGEINYKEVVPGLIAALDDKDGEVRQSVAAALAAIGSPAVKPLLEVFKDSKKDAGLRANAAYVLGQIGPSAREALPELLKAIKPDFPESDVQVRKRAAFAVSQMVGTSYYGPVGYPGMPEPASGKMKAADPGLVVPARVIKRD